MLKNIVGDWGSELDDADYACALAALGVLEAKGTLQHPATSETATLVTALANEFIAAGFLEARESYRGKYGLVRQGNGVALKTFGTDREAPEVRLTLRIGERVKRVSLIADYPDVLGKLPELVDRIGGPNTWPVR